jgi:hypothetical protein
LSKKTLREQYRDHVLPTHGAEARSRATEH